MPDYLDNNLELHLKSTVGELVLYDNSLDIRIKVKAADALFTKNPMLPGILLFDKKEYVGMISRKSFYETISKPYCYELYYDRSLHFLFESIIHYEPLVISSSFEISEAVSKTLVVNKENLTDPILVTFENGTIKILDIYQLILANSKINLIAMKAFKEANELKTEMLSIAAHDLKNPLNTALGFTKLIKEDIDTCKTDTLELLNLVEISLSNMYSLIIELLNSSVIEAGKLELKMQIIDIVELLSAITYLNKSNAAKKNQSLEFIHDRKNDYYIKGDFIKIREAIENLVSNALKYSPFDSEIIIGVNKIEEYCQIYVKDKGPGFTNEDLTKIFGKFQRLSAQPTGGESSSGLGLYISKQIIELHEGRIYVNSCYNNGSTFIIEIPAISI